MEGGAVRASTTCSACGETQLRQDGLDFWTREPRFLELQEWLKIGAVTVALGVAAWLLVPVFNGSQGLRGYRGVGFALAPPFLVGLVLWDTASLVTRRRSSMRMELLWPNMAWMVGVGPVALAVFLQTFVGRSLAWLQDPEFHSLAIPWVLVWWGVGLAVRRFVRWLGLRRRSYVVQRIAAHGSAEASMPVTNR